MFDLGAGTFDVSVSNIILIYYFIYVSVIVTHILAYNLARLRPGRRRREGAGV